MTAHPLTFWHCAGDIIWRGDGRWAAVTEFQARSLRDEFKTACRAAYNAGDFAPAAKAARLWMELGNALDALATWKRVVGRDLAPFETAAHSVGEIIEGLGRRLPS